MKKKIIISVSVLISICLLGVGIVVNLPHIKASELVDAIETENCAKVEKMLKDGVNPNVTTTSDIDEFILNIVESSGKRPITVACEVGNLEIVEMLLAHGATAEPTEKGGWSPLRETLFVYQAQDKEILELLLSHGAQVEDGAKDELPIFTAAQMFPRKYDKEKSNGTYYTGEYNEEIAKGITEIVFLMLERGRYDINIKSSYETTLLMYAAEKGNKYLVEQLIASGCDVSAKNKLGKTALDYANEKGYVDVADILVAAK